MTDHDGFRRIELSHGKVNALDLELLEALVAAFVGTPPIRPVVLTGAGRAFSAGVDLKRIVEGGPRYIQQFLPALSRCFLAVYDHPAPVVAAVNGPAIAGGCVIAAACDRRIVSAGPIGLAELAVGVPFPTVAVAIVRSVLGSATPDLLLSGSLLDPAAARAVGLADAVVGGGELLERASSEARRLGALPAGVFEHTKRQLQAPARDQIAQQASVEDPIAEQLWASGGVRDAIGRYVPDLTRRR